MSDTIAAAATAAAESAVGILRLSGSDAIKIADSVFRAFSGLPLSLSENRKLVYGELKDSDGAVLDRCLATVSRAPSSYTGENTAEFQCHGSPVVLAEGLRSLFAAGARQAEAGEFTKRAFLNGKLDLSSAEAVADLIGARTPDAAKNAAAQLGGAICAKFDEVYQSLSDICSHFQAIIDYPDEDIEEVQREDIARVLSSSIQKLRHLSSSFEAGKVLKNGVTSAIIGIPNVGKSSLLNALLGYERAIVTSVPGTTRDTVESELLLGSVLFRLSDTAGIRGETDSVERLGIERSISAAETAALVIAVFDSSREFSPEDENILTLAAKAKKSVLVLNKCDLAPAFDAGRLPQTLPLIRVSARNGEGLDKLAETVSSLFSLPPANGDILTNARQAEAAGRALEGLASAENALLSGVTPDAVLCDVEAAMGILGEILGRSVKEDVVNGIFAHFCVGK